MTTYRLIKRTKSLAKAVLIDKTTRLDYEVTEYFILEKKGIWKFSRVGGIFYNRQDVYDYLHKTGKYRDKSEIVEYITI